MPKARQEYKTRVQALIDNPSEIVTIGEKKYPLYGHVSCRTIKEWDTCLAKLNFNLIDFRRGSTIYGGSNFYNNDVVLGLRMIFEGFLDRLPLKMTRHLSDQLIALYQVNK